MAEFVIADTHFDHIPVVLHCGRTPWIYPNLNYDSKKPFNFTKNNPNSVDIEKHNQDLKDNWNARVGKKDGIKILGDLAFKNHKQHIQSLNGRKTLIKGNHDDMNRESYDLFQEYDVDETSFVNELQKEMSSLLKRFKNGDIDLIECQQTILSNSWNKFMQVQGSEDIDQMSSACYGLFNGVHEMGMVRKMGVKKRDPKGNMRDVPVTFCHYAMKSWASSVHGSWILYGHSHGRMPEFDNMFAFDVGVDVWGYAPVPWEAVIEKMKRIESKINEKGDRYVDGENAAKGTYSKNPEQRIIETRQKNKEIMRSLGYEIIEKYWPK